MALQVDLIVPLKPPYFGKSRLRGALGCASDDETHRALVLAIAADTLTAATAAADVQRVLVVTSDPEALSELDSPRVHIISENGAGSLNAAVEHAEGVLREDQRSPSTIAVLQGDLPALRAVDLSNAIREANGVRAFSADMQGTGTTLLISARGGALRPFFGIGSAQKHASSGAIRLRSCGPSVRSDVDTAADLVNAASLGLGQHTTALLEATRCVH